jgi:hypothetical protein
MNKQSVILTKWVTNSNTLLESYSQISLLLSIPYSPVEYRTSIEEIQNLNIIESSIANSDVGTKWKLTLERVDLITITDEMLESAHIEESDIKLLREMGGYGRDKDVINLESTIVQALSKKLGSNATVYLFQVIRDKYFSEGQSIGLARGCNALEGKFTQVKKISCSQEYMAGWEAAIKELNEVYLGSLESE